MNRLWQAAGTVQAVLKPNLLDKAVKSGLRSLFIGFETTDTMNLYSQNKIHNINYDYQLAIKRLQERGVMINGSFVFGLDEDDESVFDRTVDWAIKNGIETSTFHILTPYPSTKLYHQMLQSKRLFHQNWDLYDTRHTVFQPKKMTPSALEMGYHRAYKDFYKWSSIFKSSMTKDDPLSKLRHFAYSAGWKKFDLPWHLLITLKKLPVMRGLLEILLDGMNTTQPTTLTQVQPIQRTNQTLIYEEQLLKKSQ